MIPLGKTDQLQTKHIPRRAEDIQFRLLCDLIAKMSRPGSPPQSSPLPPLLMVTSRFSLRRMWYPQPLWALAETNRLDSSVDEGILLRHWDLSALISASSPCGECLLRTTAGWDVLYPA